MARYIEVFSEAVRSWSGQHSDQYAGYNKMVEALSTLTPEKVLENRTALVGPPEEVVKQVRFIREMFGEHESSMQINFGGISERDAFRTLELFATRVMPEFRTPAAPVPSGTRPRGKSP